MKTTSHASAPAVGAQHTPGALRLAAILIPDGIDRRGHPSRLKTAYGEKTRDGIADMIDNETGAPDLLAALAVMEADATYSDEDTVKSLRARLDNLSDYARAALAKAKGTA